MNKPYHVGFLAVEREHDRGLDGLAKLLLDQFERGKVYLVQKKLGPGKWEYWAIPMTRE
jgi:hypothetical protein